MTKQLQQPPSFFERIQPVPRHGGFRMENYWVWCGSVIADQSGKYHMFASRWPKALPMFAGYIVTSEIVRAVADTPEGPYQYAETVLPCSSSDAWDGRMAHNPTIHKYGDTYFLYYIGSTYSGEIPGGQIDPSQTAQCQESYSNIRIGLATAQSLEGPWTVLNHPILEPRPGKWDGTVVTNPAPCIHPDGRVLMFYRSNTPNGLRLGLAGADHPLGPYRRFSDDPVLRVSGDNHVEDPFVWWNNDHYEMLAKDIKGGLTSEVNAGAHFLSSDGLNWTLASPPKAYSRTITYTDGETIELGSVERPQILFDTDGLPLCLFAATADGPGGFRQAINTWNMAIPLKHKHH